MSVLELAFECGESSLSVRHFRVDEAISKLFTVKVVARSPAADIDLEKIVGKPASLRAITGYKFARDGGARLWTGICRKFELVHGMQPIAGQTPLSTYEIEIVPTMWVVTQRTNYRIFQHITIPDIVRKLLAEWRIEARWQITEARYPRLEYKVQYGETDWDFINRLLEEAGISFTFPDDDEKGSRPLFADEPHKAPQRPGPALPFVDKPNESSELEFVTNVHFSHEVRPGAHGVVDYDFRNPAFQMQAEAQKVKGLESKYEIFDYEPGGFLIETSRPSTTPHADDKGIARYEMTAGKLKAENAQLAIRADQRHIKFTTNTIDIFPGVIFSISGHPHPDVDDVDGFLVTEFSLEGKPESAWDFQGKGTFVDAPYVPIRKTAKPIMHGVESATVVGPPGQEIHTDEFGRIRVQFPWDREGKLNDDSSCWVRVNQGWGGAAYGFAILPRIGQEVLVSYLEGDPEQPVVSSRVYNAISPVPYKLPDRKTESAYRSETSPGGGGYNELRYDDLAGEELFYMQAQRNQRQLIKNDETITVVHDRIKHVEKHEYDTTLVDRLEDTGHDRIETTWGIRTVIIEANRRILTKKNEFHRTERRRWTLVIKDAHHVVAKHKRDLIEGDSHVNVVKDLREKVDGKRSLQIMEVRNEKVGGSHALATGKNAYLKAGEKLTGEAGMSVTAKGPGGFVHIDATGVTISGTLVKINAGGSAGNGSAPTPEDPEKPEVARIDPPLLPPEGPPLPPGERTVTALIWSQPRVPVGDRVYAVFHVRGFAGGELATIEVFEYDGEERKQVATLMGSVGTSDGRIRIPWERDENEVNSELAEDDGQTEKKIAPTEYRFEVTAGGIRAEGTSGPLWLTKTVEVDLVEDQDGEKRKPVDGTRVTVTGADGASRMAPTKNGIARVRDIVVGKRIWVRVEDPDNGDPGTSEGGQNGG
jgi:type VI secretion system secreted protein VgrG